MKVLSAGNLPQTQVANPTGQKQSPQATQQPTGINVQGLQEGDNVQLQVKNGQVQIIQLPAEEPTGFFGKAGAGIVGTAASSAGLAVGSMALAKLLSIGSAAPGAGQAIGTAMYLGAAVGAFGGLVGSATVAIAGAEDTTDAVKKGAIAGAIAGASTVALGNHAPWGIAAAIIGGGIAGAIGGTVTGSMIKQ